MQLERYLRVSARRLERLQGRLGEASRKLSWLRVGVFGVFFVAFVATVELRLWAGVWTAALLGSLIFGVLVNRHQRIRRLQRRTARALQLKREHRARRDLDWDGIPAQALEAPLAQHPFENDLDITGPYSLLRLLNTGLSVEGSARLKNWLLALDVEPEVVKRRQAIVAELRGQLALREGLQLALAESAAQYRQAVDAKGPWRSAEVLDLLTSLPERRPGRSLALLSGLALVNLVMYSLASLKLVPALGWQLSLSAYVLLFWSQRSRIQQLFKEAQQLQFGLARLNELFAWIERLTPSRGPALGELLAPFARPDKPSDLLRHLGRVVGAASLQGNPLVWVGFNLLAPWDFYFAWRLEQLKPRLREQLPQWLEALWELEALSSLAHYAWLHPQAPFPNSAEQGIEVIGIGHPLIPEASKVRNDFSLTQTGQAFLITGSNMAGKSTFLKSLGLNLVLAQAGTVVDAQSFTAAPLRLFTCIRVSDSVTDGLSYFYTEVRRLKALLDAIETPHPHAVFFLVDEIFKGTNNRERLIGSRAYIQALTRRNGLGGISTHDLELVQLADANSQIENYHFRETISEGRMHFDFKLRQGPCPTTNALRIMALEGLPVGEEWQEEAAGRIQD
jgi:hypothetical protein